MLTLLAQAQNQNQMTEGEAAALLVTMLAFVLVMLAFMLAIQIVICALLHGCFNRIPPQFRKMDGGLVWLLLIPIFALFWNFMVYLRLSESYQAYFGSLGRTDVGDCGRGVGLWYCICAVCALVPCVNYLAGPAALVLLIIFLVKALTLKGMIPLGGSPPPGAAPPVAPA